MEFELNDFLNGLLCRKDIKIKQPINSNTIAEAVNEYLKNKPASPPSMPDDKAIREKIEFLYPLADEEDYPENPNCNRIANASRGGFMNGIYFMRSQFDAKQKNELTYAIDLAKMIHQEYYSHVTNWEPLDSLYGVLSQIDNMICGIKNQCDGLIKHKDEEIKSLMEQNSMLAKQVKNNNSKPFDDSLFDFNKH